MRSLRISVSPEEKCCSFCGDAVMRMEQRRIRLKVVPVTLVLSISLWAIVVFAYTPFQDRVGGVVYPSRWTTSNVTWNYFHPASPPANVDTTSGCTAV